MTDKSCSVSQHLRRRHSNGLWLVNSAGGFFFVVKTANPSLSLPCNLNKFLFNGFKPSAEGRKRQFTFSDGYQAFTSDMSGKEDFLILQVQGWPTLLAACPASYATGYVLKELNCESLFAFFRSSFYS